MTLMGKSNPLGGAVCAYTPGTILFDGSNGDSATLQMKKGFYFIRGQGAGAGGGNCGLYGTASAAGSVKAFTEPAAEAVPVPVLKETSISPTTKTT